MCKINFGFIFLIVLLSSCSNTTDVKPKAFANAYECIESKSDVPDAAIADIIKYEMAFVKYCYQFAENETQKEFLVDKATDLFIFAEKIKRLNAMISRTNRTLEPFGIKAFPPIE